MAKQSEASVLLSLLQALRQSMAAMEAFAALKAQAQAEGREISDAELDQLKADTEAEQRRLIGGV